ncbi:MAG: TPR repeat protein [Glaciecola sp.]
MAGIKYPGSACLLAQYYDHGIGMAIDTKQVLKWYEIAASQGYKEAYLPTIALYWDKFIQNDNDELLAKSYLWTQASCLTNNVTLESRQPRPIPNSSPGWF